MLGVFKAFIEGLLPARQNDRPIGLKHFDYFSNDELLNQLSQPLFKYEPTVKYAGATAQPVYLSTSLSKKAAPAFTPVPAATYGMRQSPNSPLFKI